MLWEVIDSAHPKPLSGTPSPVECLAVSPDGKHLVVGGGDGQLRLWALSGKMEEIPRRFPSGKEPIYAVAFSPDGKHIASAGGRMGYKDGKVAPEGCVVRIWELASGERVHELPGHTRPIRSRLGT